MDMIMFTRPLCMTTTIRTPRLITSTNIPVDWYARVHTPTGTAIPTWLTATLTRQTCTIATITSHRQDGMPWRCA